jgi:hypothetical protein
MYRRRWQLAFLTHSEAQNAIKISGTSPFELQDSDHPARCTLNFLNNKMPFSMFYSAPEGNGHKHISNYEQKLHGSSA